MRAEGRLPTNGISEVDEDEVVVMSYRSPRRSR
jgi:hypothetical protein